MSKQVIETRVCDQCSATYAEDVPSWMILHFPNASGAVEQNAVPEFDFCTYQCLEAWVNEEDKEDEPEARSPEDDVQAETESAPRAHLETDDAGVPRVVRDEVPRPVMSLADAIASGLRPGNPVGGQ